MTANIVILVFDPELGEGPARLLVQSVCLSVLAARSKERQKRKRAGPKGPAPRGPYDGAAPKTVKEMRLTSAKWSIYCQ